MNPRKYETIVGIFVVASLAALLIMVLIIAQQEGLWQEKLRYHAAFRNIAGLKKGDEVRLAGVTVGNVTDITIDPQGNIVLTFDVLKRYADRLREDSKSTIGYKSLLGEKSLDITAGSPTKPVIPPDGLVASVEPLDVTELLAKAGPSLESLQVVLNNLASLTGALGQPESEFNQTLQEIRQIVAKIEQGQGSLGLLVNDKALYQETTQTVAAARSFAKDLEEGRGLMGTVLNDPAFKARAQQTLADMQAAFANLKQVSASLKETAAAWPRMVKSGETFLDNLNRTGKLLPGLVSTGEGVLSEADQVAKAAQRSWLLRRYVPTPKEHTIRLESNPGKD